MGRRETAQLELELPEEALREAPVEPARRTRGASEARRRRPGRLRWWAAGAALVALVIVVGLAFYQVDQFLASDPRFTLAGDAQVAEDSGLRIEGAVYASPARLRQVFATDFGRSVYLIPLEARRRDLLAVDWVREARVERHWPNRIVARIAERVPVAFVVLPFGASAASRMGLIDAEGVLLAAPERADFELPVLRGVSPAQPQGARRELVSVLLRFLREAGLAAGQISEVDASDPANLKVIALVEGAAVRLLLGNASFRPRLENFLSRYDDIRWRFPRATTFDLRLDGRITVAEGARDGR